MNVVTVWSLVALIVFIIILAVPKLPNWLTFPCLGPIAVYSGILSPSDVYGALSSSGLQLMIIICMFSGMIASTGLDIVIGNVLDKLTCNLKGNKKEMTILAILYLISGAISAVLQNSYVAMAFLPVIFSISKRYKISYSKLILFVIFATTMGGACTLIGTPTNVYANQALEEAGLALFGMLDFAWIGLPIFILGGFYMVLLNKWCPSYEESLPTDVKIDINTEITPEMKKKQLVVGISFVCFLASMVIESFLKVKCYPFFVGYSLIALSVISMAVSPKEVMSSLNAELIVFCAGINLLIIIMKASALGDIFGTLVISILGDNKNLYFITAVLFIGSWIMTSFMNNMATAGMLAPIGISIAEALGANPQAIVLAIAIGAGCSFMTPIASGTNQCMVVFSNLKFTDFAKFGWPLAIISLICCVTILPLVFPFF